MGEVAPRPPVIEESHAAGLRSFAAAPLTVEDRYTGHLFVGSVQVGAFDEPTREILAEVADQIAVGLRQAELREELERHSGELEARVAERTAQLEATLAETEAEVTVEGPLPTVLAHPATAVQVVANLVSNAAKFVAPGATPRVRVRAERNGDAARLWVEDNGIGIKPEHGDRIFRGFERLHSTSAYPGTGIGLAMVRKGIERMGGRVGVEPGEGGGSRFWIELGLGERS